MRARRPCFHFHLKTGAALVVVLALLVMLAILLVTFLSAVSVDTQSASASKAQAALRQLDDLPLQIVETQIRAATTLGQTGSLSNSVNTWTSQPGLMRVFSNEGDLVRAFKLYSSSTMEAANMSFLGSDIPDDWPNQPNRYVNLNEPYRSLTQTDADGLPKLVWPILNPAAENWAEGLTIGADPAGQTDATMPVEWLYVLADGNIVSQDALTAANPPMGRIAFWADDESCKVNINTAGERTMWDRPRYDHDKAVQFSKNQPSTGEYNAYPGHPATVSLSAVFGKSPEVAALSENALRETMLSLTPRYRWGGSENGTRSIWQTRTELDRTKNPANNKNDRLFATPSEFLFNAARDVNLAVLREPIEESGFLLTESSRAPELNAFGLPRVGIWPMDASTSKRTVFDNLIAHGTTIGSTAGTGQSKPYYFQRSAPDARDEATSIERNWELLEYLDALTAHPISGFSNSSAAGGLSFADKWDSPSAPNERRQILTQIFDYIRTVNLSDTSRNVTEYELQFTPANADDRGVVLPTEIPAWDTRGAGRVPVLARAGLVFYAVNPSGEVPPGSPVPTSPNVALTNESVTHVKCMLWFNFFSPMYGLAPHGMRIQVRINTFDVGISSAGSGESNSFSLTDTERNFTFPNSRDAFDWGGAESMIGNYDGSSWGSSGRLMENYEFNSSNSIAITGTSMDFRGGLLEVQIFDGRDLASPIQTYRLDFPSHQGWPVPRLRLDGTSPDQLTGELRFRSGNTGNALLGRRAANGDESTPFEVIRGIELKDGDTRLVAHLETVPASFYQPGYGYFSPTIMLGGHLLFGRDQAVLEHNSPTPVNNFSGLGRYIEGVKPTVTSLGRNFRNPSLPHAVSGVPLTSFRSVNWAGDIDNGFINEADGPYMNKSDEGHSIEPSPTRIPYKKEDGFSDTLGIDSKWDPSINGFFSPTRQIPSAIMLGSLPAGVKRSEGAYINGNLSAARPWETLLFCANSQADMVADSNGEIGHPGRLAPPDHLLLDLFTMPVVEPYAISEPFSTAGKINLNQRLIPFGHIRRETGLWAAMKNLELVGVPDSPGAANPAVSTPVDVPATLVEIAEVLDPDGETGAGVFRAASEICDIPLIPSNLGASSLQSYWQARQRTGDNSREAPYNYLYPLLTTKSNTFQIYYRVQSLAPLEKKAGFDPQNDFIVTGEQRGSYVVERYLDVNDPRFSDGSIDPDVTPLNEFYQFRRLRHSRFSPGS